MNKCLNCFGYYKLFSTDIYGKTGIFVILASRKYIVMMGDCEWFHKGECMHFILCFSPYGNSCEKSSNMPATWPFLVQSGMTTRLMEALCQDRTLIQHFLTWDSISFLSDSSVEHVHIMGVYKYQKQDIPKYLCFGMSA